MEESKDQRRGSDTWPKSGIELGAYLETKFVDGETKGGRGADDYEDEDKDELCSHDVEITKTWGADGLARDASSCADASRSPEQEVMVGGELV